MSLYITAQAAQPNPEFDKAVDAASFYLSEGNFREFLDHLELDPAARSFSLAAAIEKSLEFREYYEGKIVSSETMKWFLGVNDKFFALCECAAAYEGDEIAAL